MIRNILIIAILAGLATVFVSLFWNFGSSDTLTPLATHYANNGVEEVGAPNLVTSVIVTYRGLDTLGEVTILFLVAAIVSFFLKTENTNKEENSPKRETSEIILTASRLLMPIVMVLGIYVFVNGHLTPGGGFQGGAIVATSNVNGKSSFPNQSSNNCHCRICFRNFICIYWSTGNFTCRWFPR